jgi:hypothetical protein
VLTRLWCQPISDASGLLASAQFWCQWISGASPALVSAHFWCQPISGCQRGFGVSRYLVPIAIEQGGCNCFDEDFVIVGDSLNPGNLRLLV